MSKVLKMPIEDVTYEMAMNEYQETLNILQVLVKDTVGLKEQQLNQSTRYQSMKQKVEALQNKASDEIKQKLEDEKQKYLNIDTSKETAVINKIKQDIKDLEEQYNQACSEITEETAKEQLSDIQEDIDELRKYVSTIQEQLEDRLGINTLSAINARIDAKGSPTLTDDELNELQDMANNLVMKIEKQLNRKQINVYKVVDVVVDGTYNTMARSMGNDTADKAFITLALSMIAVMYFWEYGVFLLAIPFAIMAGSFYNTYTSNKSIVNEYVPLRQLSQLADMKEETMNEQLKTIMEDMQLEIDNDFNEIMEEYQSKLIKAEEHLRSMKDNALADFDQRAFVQNLQDEYNERIRQLAELGKEEYSKLQECEEKCKKHLLLLNEMKGNLNLLRDITQKLATQLTKVGSSYNLPEFFFLGINDQTGKPMLFNWEKRANVIIYKEEAKDSIQQIISTIQSQIIMYTNPTKVLPYLVELQKGGIDYNVFNPREEWKLPQIFKRITSSNEVAEMMNTVTKVNQNVLGKILNDHDSIHDFNKAMLEKNSLTSEFHIIYFVNYSPTIFSDNTLKQVIENSEKIGIIPLIFVHEDVITGIKTGNTNLYEQGHLELFKTIGRESVWRMSSENIGLSQVQQPDGEIIYEADVLKNEIKKIEEGK